MTAKLTEAMRANYERKWLSCEVDYELDAVRSAAHRVLAVKEQCRGFWDIPWWFVALCWYRECNLHPKGCLHNGQLIIGTGRLTTIVPVGRGPFATWGAAARDALHLQGLDHATSWSLPFALFTFEGFNGFGYHNKGVPAPYLWSHTNHYADGSWDDDPKGGKFIRDHVWDANTYDKQIGVCAILRILVDLDPTINLPRMTINRPPAPIPPSIPASPTIPAHPILRRGDKGPDVRALQQALKDQHYALAVDGDFGLTTLLCVQRFQRSKGLSADGLVGPVTLAALGFPRS